MNKKIAFNKCMVCDKTKIMPDKDVSICGECHAKLIWNGCDKLLPDNIEIAKLLIGLSGKGREKNETNKTIPKQKRR